MASNVCKCAVQSSRDPGAIGRKQIPSAVECCKTILGGISVKLPWPSINSPQVLASSHCHKQGTQLNIYPEFAPQKNTWKYHTNKTNCLWEKIGLHPFLPWWWRLSNSDQRQRTVKNEMKHRRPSAQQSLTSASTYWKLGLCLTPELLPGDSWADQTGEKKKKIIKQKRNPLGRHNRQEIAGCIWIFCPWIWDESCVSAGCFQSCWRGCVG